MGRICFTLSGKKEAAAKHLLSGNFAGSEIPRGLPRLGGGYRSRFSGRPLFGRLPVEMLFVCLCGRLGGMHYAITMVRRSVERVELHRA